MRTYTYGDILQEKYPWRTVLGYIGNPDSSQEATKEINKTEYQSWFLLFYAPVFLRKYLGLHFVFFISPDLNKAKPLRSDACITTCSPALRLVFLSATLLWGLHCIIFEAGNEVLYLFLCLITSRLGFIFLPSFSCGTKQLTRTPKHGLEFVQDS